VGERERRRREQFEGKRAEQRVFVGHKGSNVDGKFFAIIFCGMT
jgi:hypothetical protein